MRKLLVICALLSVSICLASAAPADAEIGAIEKNWAAAVAANDFAKLDGLLGDDLIYAHSTGAVESKAEYLKRLHSGAQKYDAITHEKTTVHVYGETAVAHSHVRMTGKSNGAPFDDRLMMMHVWVKKGSSWQLVAHQTTKLVPAAK